MNKKLQKCMYLMNLIKRSKGLTYNDINDFYVDSTYSDGEDLNKRTLTRYLNDIRDEFGCDITYNRSSQKYEVVQDDGFFEDDGLEVFLQQTFHIGALSDELKRFKSKVKLSNVPTGADNLQAILKAFDEKKGIECDYVSFEQSSIKHHTLIPYFLRVWEQRWYLVAEICSNKKLSIFALERMRDVSTTADLMSPSQDISIDEYFDGCFGIYHKDDQKPVSVRIKVSHIQANYLKMVPIHESQAVEEENDDFSIFKYRIVLCDNFYQELLWHSKNIEVLGPPEVRDGLFRFASSIADKYKD